MPQSYHQQNKGYLTSSKLKAYLQDPYYFYQLYIAKEKEFKQTPSMRLGSAIDMWLTENRAKFVGTYEQKVKRSEDKELYDMQQNMDEQYLLTPAEYEKVQTICESVEATTFWQEIKKDSNWIRQAILRMDKEGGIGPHFKGVSGKPDLYKIKGTKAIIIDLKTASDIEPRRFGYACRDFGYFVQQAFYQMLIMHLNPKVKVCESFIVATETGGWVNRTKLYRMNQGEIETEKVNILGWVDEISKIKKYKPTDLTWDDVEEI